MSSNSPNPDKMRARMVGVGGYSPEKIMTNFDLEKLVDTTDEWIRTRTGISERRIAADGQTLSDMAAEASLQALEMAGMKASDLDLIICATITGNQPCPATACFVAAKINAGQAPAFDLAAGCSGFIYALHVARQFIENGGARNILVIGGEILSRFMDYDDRSTCVIFGDGCGAAVLRAEKGEIGILSTAAHSEGTMAEFIEVRAGGSTMPSTHDTVDKKMHSVSMKGQETFKLAVRSLTEVSEQAIEMAGLTKDAISWYIPHQANIRIINAVGSRFKVPPERMVVNIDRMGNTSAGSVPLALNEAVRDGRIKEGDIILMAAFGAGLTWGSAVVRW